MMGELERHVFYFKPTCLVFGFALGRDIECFSIFLGPFMYEFNWGIR